MKLFRFRYDKKYLVRSLVASAVFLAAVTVAEVLRIRNLEAEDYFIPGSVLLISLWTLGFWFCAYSIQIIWNDFKLLYAGSGDTAAKFASRIAGYAALISAGVTVSYLIYGWVSENLGNYYGQIIFAAAVCVVSTVLLLIVRNRKKGEA